MTVAKKNRIQVVRLKKGATETAALALARKRFSAADLQKFTETEIGIPARQVLAEMQAIHRNVCKKSRKNKKS